MKGFPVGFLEGFLATQNVSCFAGAESHREIRKHSLETSANIGGTGFPPLTTSRPLGNILFPVGFLGGFL